MSLSVVSTKICHRSCATEHEFILEAKHEFVLQLIYAHVCISLAQSQVFRFAYNLTNGFKQQNFTQYQIFVIFLYNFYVNCSVRIYLFFVIYSKLLSFCCQWFFLIRLFVCLLCIYVSLFSITSLLQIFCSFLLFNSRQNISP